MEPGFTRHHKLSPLCNFRSISQVRPYLIPSSHHHVSIKMHNSNLPGVAAGDDVIEYPLGLITGNIAKSAGRGGRAVLYNSNRSAKVTPFSEAIFFSVSTSSMALRVSSLASKVASCCKKCIEGLPKRSSTYVNKDPSETSPEIPNA